MHLDDELHRIQQIGSAAWALAEKGDFQAARKALRKIATSCCVSESEQMIALVEAKILHCSGDYPAAKTRILQSMGYLWGISDGLEIAKAHAHRGVILTHPFRLLQEELPSQ